MCIKKIIRLSSEPLGFGEITDDIEPLMFIGELPKQHTHSYYENDELGLYIGTWASTAMIESGGPYSSDEFMWVLEGSVEVKNNQSGLLEQVHAGEAFVIPKGYDCQWRQQGYLRKFYVISAHPNEIIPSSPVIDHIVKPTLAIQDTDEFTRETTHVPFLYSKTATQKEQECYQDSKQRFFVGTWESEPFESTLLAFPVSEFVYLQSGRLLILDEYSVEHIFTAGDAFFIPQGTICQWRVIETIRTFYTVISAKKTG